MIPIWQVAVFGAVLFAAYLVLLVVALRKQRGASGRQLARLRAALRRSRNLRFVEAASSVPALPEADDPWIPAIRAEFDAMMRAAFVEGGEGR